MDFTLIILFIVITVWYTIKVYNQIKPLDISVNEYDSNIKVVLEKRLVILDKLNDIVNSYSQYEKDIIEKLSDDMKANTNSTVAINRLSDVYPDLKLNDTFLNQVENLYLIESEKQGTIEVYNNRVKKYNERVTCFPEIMFCSVLSFKEKKFFI